MKFRAKNACTDCNQELFIDLHNKCDKEKGFSREQF